MKSRRFVEVVLLPAHCRRRSSPSAAVRPPGNTGTRRAQSGARQARADLGEADLSPDMGA